MFNRSPDSLANIDYIGRFAPSPTGPLHFGSLLAALASYLDAKFHHGQWLVRIEDIDPPREVLGATDLILKTLEIYGLYSEQNIIYQSQRSDVYQHALDQLIQQKSVFPCTCSRKQLADGAGIHFGNCHSLAQESASQQFAWRFDSKFATPNPPSHASFYDHLQGNFSQSVAESIGDFVVRRKDQLWAYQLAMVVDDFQQGVTHVVRGIDLIDSTLRQNMLQYALNYPVPEYAHIPVACAENGQKLSKQNLAPGLDLDNPQVAIWRALAWLRQKPPENLRAASVKEMLSWAVAHWQPLRLQHVQNQAAI
ncbi:MAG: glutamyl-Q tRNA(Asp) synthetase [Oleispira sp.]